MKAVSVWVLIAAGFWLIMFSPWTAGAVSFWPMMAIASGVLAAVSLILQRRRSASLYRFSWKHVYQGLLAAVVLYALFWTGNLIFRQYSFGAREVAAVYQTKQQASDWVIGWLLLLWIGPAEEIFWRGFVQARLSKHFGLLEGYGLAALLYAGVHIWSFNSTLFLASLICGLFWGWLFVRTRSLWPAIISHAVWDVAIFVWFPLA